MLNKVIREEEIRARELASKVLGDEAESHGIWRFIRIKIEDDPKYSNQLELFAILDKYLTLGYIKGKIK